MKQLWISFLLLFQIHSSYAQKSLMIESKVGTGSTKVENRGNFPDLVASSGDQFFLILGIYKPLKNGFSYGLELEHYRFGLYLTYTPLDPVKNKGGSNFRYYAFGPKFQKDFFITSKAGVSLSTALHLTYNAQGDYTFTGGELQTVLLPNGQPRIPVRLYGQRSVEEISIHIKPELGVFYDLSDKSRITLSARWGLDLREPSVVIDLNRIEFEENNYQNKYFFSGNYFSTLLGYRYSF